MVVAITTVCSAIGLLLLEVPIRQTVTLPVCSARPTVEYRAQSHAGSILNSLTVNLVRVASDKAHHKIRQQKSTSQIRVLIACSGKQVLQIFGGERV